VASAAVPRGEICRDAARPEHPRDILFSDQSRLSWVSPPLQRNRQLHGRVSPQIPAEFVPRMNSGHFCPCPPVSDGGGGDCRPGRSKGTAPFDSLAVQETSESLAVQVASAPQAAKTPPRPRRGTVANSKVMSWDSPAADVTVTDSKPSVGQTRQCAATQELEAWYSSLQLSSWPLLRCSTLSLSLSSLSSLSLSLSLSLSPSLSPRLSHRVTHPVRRSPGCTTACGLGYLEISAGVAKTPPQPRRGTVR
jgi:hypothetical protein